MEGEDCDDIGKIKWDKVFTCCEKRCNAIGMKCRQSTLTRQQMIKYQIEPDKFVTGMGVTNNNHGNHGIKGIISKKNEAGTGAVTFFVYHIDNTFDRSVHPNVLKAVPKVKQSQPLDFLLRYSIPTTRLVVDGENNPIVMPLSQIPDLRPPYEQIMVAQYDWTGQRDDDDLYFKKGDLIGVVERCEDPGWLIGEVIRDDEKGSSVRGMFPESFCDPFQEDADNAPRASPTRTQKKKAPRRKNQKDSAQAPKPPAQNQKKKTIKTSEKK